MSLDNPVVAKHAAHPTVERLLAFVRNSTRDSADPVIDMAGLARRLAAAHVSAQVFTNWKSRGISKEGALICEQQFGCSALWIREGAGAPVSELPKEALDRAAAWQALSPASRALIDQAISMASTADTANKSTPPGDTTKMPTHSIARKPARATTRETTGWWAKVRKDKKAKGGA